MELYPAYLTTYATLQKIELSYEINGFKLEEGRSRLDVRKKL